MTFSSIADGEKKTVTVPGARRFRMLIFMHRLKLKSSVYFSMGIQEEKKVEMSIN